MRYVCMGALVVLALAGCAGKHTGTLTIAQSCRAYGGALQVLAPHRDAKLLSPETVETVNNLNEVTDPICEGEPPADTATAIARVNAAVTRVMLLAAEGDAR